MIVKRYKLEDVELVRPFENQEYGTPHYRTKDGEFVTMPAPRSGAQYWLDSKGNPLPARDKRDVVMVYEEWMPDAVKTLNRLLGRQAKDEKRFKLWFAEQDAYKK